MSAYRRWVFLQAAAHRSFREISRDKRANVPPRSETFPPRPVQGWWSCRTCRLYPARRQIASRGTSRQATADDTRASNRVGIGADSLAAHEQVLDPGRLQAAGGYLVISAIGQIAKARRAIRAPLLDRPRAEIGRAHV